MIYMKAVYINWFYFQIRKRKMRMYLLGTMCRSLINLRIFLVAYGVTS